jgi:hypothetical protein
MFRTRFVLFVLVVVLNLPKSGFGQIVFVESNGPNDPGSGTAAEPFLRIQDAIDASVDGDVIEIRPGIYTGLGNYDLDPAGRGITVRSADPNDPGVVESTIIDSGRAGRGFCFQSGEDSGCALLGLTIRNCSSGFGGGVLCKDSSPVIGNCIIEDNSAIAYGGGVFFWGSEARFVGCVVRGNLSDAGGGIECWSGKPRVVNCLIYGNTASGSDAGGGGVDCYDSGNLVLQNCTIAGNAAPDGAGGGLLCIGSDVAVRNCILWANSAGQGVQMCLPSWLDIPATVAVTYCNIQGAQEGIHVGSTSTLDWRGGNLDVDPQFSSFDAGGDESTWDFHLQSTWGCWDRKGRRWITNGSNSPCIDGGDPNSNWAGELWPNGRRINVGAYGGTPRASLSGNPGDFDMNGSVDFVDFSELATELGLEGATVYDLDRDGAVELDDLSLFGDNWLWRRQ